VRSILLSQVRLLIFKLSISADPFIRKSGFGWFVWLVQPVPFPVRFCICSLRQNITHSFAGCSSPGRQPLPQGPLHPDRRLDLSSVYLIGNPSRLLSPQFLSITTLVISHILGTRIYPVEFQTSSRHRALDFLRGPDNAFYGRKRCLCLFLSRVSVHSRVSL
jgi:hypothetical protein